MEASNIPDSDEDDSYEEIYVYADIEEEADRLLADNDPVISVLGIETNHPIIQINNRIYKGTFDYTMGTQMFFRKNPNAQNNDDDNIYIKKATYEYFGKTTKKLILEQLLIKPKDSDAETQSSPTTDNQESSKVDPAIVNNSYVDALNQILKPGQQPPRNIKDFFPKPKTQNS